MSNSLSHTKFPPTLYYYFLYICNAQSQYNCIKASAIPPRDYFYKGKAGASFYLSVRLSHKKSTISASLHKLFLQDSQHLINHIISLKKHSTASPPTLVCCCPYFCWFSRCRKALYFKAFRTV